MLNYLKKFAVDIFPSVAATVIGAYIVNHYIVSKPGAGDPATAAVSTADPKGEGKAGAKSDSKSTQEAARSAETMANVSNLPAAGVKARGISEKAIMEKTAAERPTVVEKAQEKTEAKSEARADTKSDARPDGKSAEATAEPRRHQAAPREKEKIRVVLPSPVQPTASAVAPASVAAAPNPAPVETAAAPDERRDANDLARAAIERLRVNGEAAPRVPEAARAPEASRVVATAPSAPMLRPLPPPIMVSAPPAGEQPGQASSQPRPPYAANAGATDPQRPIPPADIPVSRPLDLRAEVAEPSVRERATEVAEDALSTAKSIFRAVLPK